MGRPGAAPASPARRAAALQAVIVELLDECGGHPEPVVHERLRRRLRARGLALPPETWLLAVAGEIAADRLYVVAHGSVPPDYAASAAAQRAARRLPQADPGQAPAVANA